MNAPLFFDGYLLSLEHWHRPESYKTEPYKAVRLQVR